MITNPYVGAKVKIICDAYYGLTGTICRITASGIIVNMSSGYTVSFYLNEVEYISLTPAEQDHQRRKEHADKYL